MLQQKTTNITTKNYESYNNKIQILQLKTTNLTTIKSPKQNLGLFI